MIDSQQIHASTTAAPAREGRVTLRSAEPGDVPWLLEQLRAFDRALGAKRSLFPDDVAWARAQLLRWMDPDAGCFIVAEHADGGRPERIGFIVGVLTPHYLNPALRMLVQALWWVVPAWRRSTAAARLLDALLAYGEVHADWIICEHPEARSGKPAFERRGLHAYERSYLLEVDRTTP